METSTVEHVSEIPAGTKFALVPAEWQGYREKIESLVVIANTITVTDASQTREMKMARETRLALKGIRCDVENRRKELVEEAVKTQRDVNKLANEIKDLCAPLENRLADLEMFAERAEEQRQEELAARRTAILAPFGVDTSLYNLGAMSLGDFARLRTGLQAALDAKIEAERIAAEERTKKEKAEAEERERAKVENERLKKESDELNAKMKAQHEANLAQAAREREEAETKQGETEATAKAEREALEAKAKKEREDSEAREKVEREKREKAEAELLAKQQKEEADKKAADLAAKKAARAPDKAKLIALATQIATMNLPTFSDPELYKVINGQFLQFAAWIEKQAENL